MKAIKIKGKEYIEVNERIKFFWEEMAEKEGKSIVTEMLSCENGNRYRLNMVTIVMEYCAKNNAGEKASLLAVFHYYR